MTRVVLGSASVGRLSVLRQAGVEPLVVVSRVDEDALFDAHRDAPPSDVVRALALAKAQDVAAALPPDVGSDAVVIGCDSMLLLDGKLCGKPGTPERARAQWASMAGNSGRLLTGHSVLRLRDGRIRRRESETASTTVHFGSPTPADLDAYIARGEPLAVAGGFTLDGMGGWFVDGIEGDPSNVVGLSLPLLRRLFARMDITVSAIWNTDTAPGETGRNSG
jgi:septum formation protein